MSTRTPPLPHDLPRTTTPSYQSMSSAALHEQRLLRAWRGGNERAGATLLAMLRLKLLQYFRRCAPDVAEDLAHDTLVAFVANRDNLRDDHALRRYLYCIAKRALIRAPSRQKVQLLSLEECASRDLAECIDLSQIDVARLLGSQSSCSVETLVEYYLGGRPAPEIARARGVEVSTVRNQIRRGLARLRRSVAEASRG